MAITHVQPPALLIMMAGTTVRQYEQAGQLGRLAASLERHAKFFRTVVLMTTDRSDYSQQFESGRVRHLRMPLPVPNGVVSLLLSAAFRFRTMRRVTSVVILDEPAAPAGWLAGRLSRSSASMSADAQWAPPRSPNVNGLRHLLVRAALRRIEQVFEWGATELPPYTPNATRVVIPSLIDSDLYCPLTTTDPAKPRTVGVFMGTESEVDARVVMGVAERLARRGQSAAIRVLMDGQGAEALAASLQAEVEERGLDVEFLTMPPVEMLPDAINQLRICVAFNDSESVQNLLRAMASGVPGIAIEPRSGSEFVEQEEPDWTYFVLRCGSSEWEIAQSIETLFREPGVRLRMAREGRRFVIANHSLEALAARESKLLLGADLLVQSIVIREPEFDAAAEAEKLAQMLELVGVTRDDLETEVEQEIAA